ncbi:MAG: ABC transporter permease subunit [Bacteroidetes bacterium]|nr:ABC transporter permease subunit [Bacteroidota bacterium]
MPLHQNIATIFHRELRSYFNSPIAYVVIIVFLVIIGWFFSSNLFLMNVASMRVVFELVPIVFLFFVPAITMRLLAEEMKSGTLELLTTKPVRDVEIILGKFLAAWVLLIAALAPTLLYVLTLTFLGQLDPGPVLTGYLGLVLMGSVYIAIGLFASSITENQIIAFILSFLIVLALFLFDKVLMYVPEGLTSILEYLSIDYHFSNIAHGVIDSRNIIYFLSLLGFSLLLATVSLERRKW